MTSFGVRAVGIYRMALWSLIDTAELSIQQDKSPPCRKHGTLSLLIARAHPRLTNSHIRAHLSGASISSG